VGSSLWADDLMPLVVTARAQVRVDTSSEICFKNLLGDRDVMQLDQLLASLTSAEAEEFGALDKRLRRRLRIFRTTSRRCNSFCDMVIKQDMTT
jgi:hypothetical protein